MKKKHLVWKESERDLEIYTDRASVIQMETNLFHSNLVTGEHDVFLSFSGTDTRKGFTDFLYTYLVDASINTFRDNEKLYVGEEIGLDLLKAIKNSKISIPIFSKSYASSKWCLNELVQMVKCHTQGGHMIYPIFYDVTPFDVRCQTGLYKEAFRQHEMNFNDTQVQEWKEALNKVGKLKGFELMKETNGHEGQLVKKVVQDLLVVLKKNYTHVDGNLVGMEGHVRAMNELLDLGSNGIKVVGIHGMGGLGKTTIAKVLYNQVCDSFESCCFLEDVRESCISTNSIVFLQNQLLCKIRKGGVSNIDNIDEGSTKIKDAIGTKRVLIVLDDVDDTYQVDKLVGQCHLFGAGSRIIVTTRNKEVLDTLEANYQLQNLYDVYRSYEPHLMGPNDSIELFSKHAFMRNSPPKDFDILAKNVVSSAGGLPLVLVTIGSSLFGKKDKSLWKEKLRKLEKIPHEKVLGRLKISYNVLEYMEKQIFLDIACFFIGEDFVNPCYMWDACGFYPKDALNVLVLRHMVKIGDDKKFKMHDHLRDLGRQIVCEENTSELGERSRLWRNKDALDTWERRMVTTKVQALNLAFSNESVSPCPRFLGDGFRQLRNLRFLNLGRAELDGDFDFSSLRWLKWECPGNLWPNNCHLKNLTVLDLKDSGFTSEWKGWNEIKMAKELKYVNLNHCKGLMRGPEFSRFTTLEILCLRCCDNMQEIDPSMQYLSSLRVLDISYSRKLTTFDCSSFSALEDLNLRYCSSLRSLDCFKKLESLKYLNIGGCAKLQTLPDVSNFNKLETLSIYHCISIINIRGLDMLECIEHLDMRGCKKIKELPSFSNLKMLKFLDLGLCERLIEVCGLEGLESLEDLSMDGCRLLNKLPELSSMKKLKKLCLRDCWKLYKVEGITVLHSLETLDLSNSGISLDSFKDLSMLKNLKHLFLRSFKDLVEIQGLEEVKSLEELDISHCISFEHLPNFSNHKRLRVIDITGCTRLNVIRNNAILRLT